MLLNWTFILEYGKGAALFPAIKEVYYLYAVHVGYRCKPGTQFTEGCKTCWCSSDGLSANCEPDTCPPEVSRQKRGRMSVQYSGYYSLNDLMTQLLCYMANFWPVLIIVRSIHCCCFLVPSWNMRLTKSSSNLFLSQSMLHLSIGPQHHACDMMHIRQSFNFLIFCGARV